MGYRKFVQISVIFSICVGASSSQPNNLIDLSGPGCDSLEAYTLDNKEEILSIYHQAQYNAISTRDRCDVTIRSRLGTRIEWIIENIQFSECGVDISLFDNESADVGVIRVITCHDENTVMPIQGKTRFNVLKIKVRKPTAASRAFTFQMRVKDDRGPPMEYESTKENYLGEGLEPGIVVGIGLAGAILIIALILLAIYLAIRARKQSMKEASEMGRPESSVYTSGTSQVLFGPGANRHPKGRYGSMEDIRSTASSQNTANGAYANPSYTTGPGEKKSERSASVGRKKGVGVANTAYSIDSSDFANSSWEEREAVNRGGPERRSRRDDYDAGGKKPLKSAMKKRPSAEEIEMGRVNTQPNGILKRNHSPSRSYTSSVEGSFDKNALIHGYGHSKSTAQQPNVHHQPVLERRRSRSGPRSQHSGSSMGRSSSRDRNRSSDRKKKAPKPGGRMYNEDVFISDNKRSRSGSRSRTRSNSLRSKRSDRYSDSVDSESSAPSYTSSTYSKKVSMNPGGKRVQIKGTETDL